MFEICYSILALLSIRDSDNDLDIEHLNMNAEAVFIVEPFL